MKNPVYEPQEDSFLLKRYIKHVAKGVVLDMCTGSGILAKEAAKYATKVIALDINPIAIEYAKEHNSDAKIFYAKSDLFDIINHSTFPEKKFDVILCNPPYLPNDLYPDPALDGGKEGWEFIEQFVVQAKAHLKPGGIILLLFSTLTKKPKVDELLRKNGFVFSQLGTAKEAFERLYLYQIKLK